jgi:competence protein ComEC
VYQATSWSKTAQSAKNWGQPTLSQGANSFEYCATVRRRVARADCPQFFAPTTTPRLETFPKLPTPTYLRDPLIPAVLGLSSGILAAHYLSFSTAESALALIALIAFAFIAHSNWLRKSAALLAVFFTGSLTETLHRPGPPPTIDATSKEIMILEGCVVEPTIFSATKEQFTLELAAGARARVSFNLDDEAPQRLDYGTRVELDARIRAPHNYNNPGSFDYAQYLTRQKIFWTATMARHSAVRILEGRCGSRFWSIIYKIRTTAVDRIEKLYPNDPYATGMMEAILIGEKSKLEKVWTENFRRTGTYHTLVIAGFHVTILAACLLFLFRICNLNPTQALAITCAAAWLYALVSGSNAPAVRAAAGFTLYAIAKFFYRRGRVLNLLSAIAILYLLCDPAQLFDAAFQLSFLCVAVIGAFAAPILNATSVPIARALKNPSAVDADPHLPPRSAQFRVELRLIAEIIHPLTVKPMALVLRVALFACELAVISTVVQIGLALPMAEYFHRVSFSGFSSNLIVTPLMGALVPVGFFAIFTGWHWPAALASGMLNISAKVVNWHAKLDPNWRIPDPPVWLALSFLASLIILAIVIPKKYLRWPALAAVVVLFILLIHQPSRTGPRPVLLELTAIDVGQGDSLLVIFPTGTKMLIDGGGHLQFGRPRPTTFDTGEDVVSPYLWSRGISRLDIVVATHAHQDHIGGLPAILENFRPKELWVGANPQQDLLSHAASLKIPVIYQHAEPAFNLFGTTVEILSPPPDFPPTKAINNDSLAFRVTYGLRSFLLTGDMEKPMEARLLSSGEDLHADVLKVGHHGSKTSTIQPFLDAVSPSIAVISDGFENSFGHPNKDVLARLEARHAAVLRTDLDGLVTVLTDGQHLTTNTKRWSNQSSSIIPVFFPADQ